MNDNFLKKKFVKFNWKLDSFTTAEKTTIATKKTTVVLTNVLSARQFANSMRVITENTNLHNIAIRIYRYLQHQ